MLTCPKCKREIDVDGAVYCCFCRAKLQRESKSNPRKRGNGQGTVIKLPNGKYLAKQILGYYIDYENGGKKRAKTVSKVFEKKGDAISALPTLKHALPARKDLNLFELHEIFTESKGYAELSKSQRDKLGYAWNRLEPLHYHGIAELTVDDMQTVIDKAVQTYYPARDMKVQLSHLFQLAIRREIVQYNKSEYIDLPDAPKAKKESWTQAEVQSLWNDYKQGHEFTGYILLMCYLGLRYGELANVPLENIHIDEKYLIAGIKTDAGIDRVIPIPDKIMPVLSSIMDKANIKLLRMNEDNFYDAYWDTIRRAELRELPPHTCRHYYFSRLTAAGVQGGIIAEIGGHANYMTTVQNYVRIPLADKLSAVNLIE